MWVNEWPRRWNSFTLSPVFFFPHDFCLGPFLRDCARQLSSWASRSTGAAPCCKKVVYMIVTKKVLCCKRVQLSLSKQRGECSPDFHTWGTFEEFYFHQGFFFPHNKSNISKNLMRKRTTFFSLPRLQYGMHSAPCDGCVYMHLVILWVSFNGLVFLNTVLFAVRGWWQVLRNMCSLNVLLLSAKMDNCSLAIQLHTLSYPFCIIICIVKQEQACCGLLDSS